MTEFTPVDGLIGGVLIGIAAVLMLLWTTANNTRHCCGHRIGGP